MDRIGSETLERVKILYVEDQVEAREELYEFLKRRVGRIYVASNGDEGLRLFRENLPDIVIADLFMPEMGGVEMVAAIRSEGFDPGVIITSAIGDAQVILKAVDAGINKYLIKPIDINILLQELTGLAEKMTARRECLPSSLENKKIMEDEIKRNFAAFLKSATGKGPKEVRVYLTESTIEVTIVDTLTIYEKTLLDNFQNCAIIKQNRDLLYDVKAAEILSFIKRITGRKAEIAKTIINIETDTSKIIINFT